MKVAIAGYGKSGQTAEEILKNKGIMDIEIFDDNIAGKKKLSSMNGSFDAFVFSPGVDYRVYNISDEKIISEIDLAYSILQAPEKIIVVTGTNGKSTTTYLISQILNKVGLKAKACGNIGNTFGMAVLEGGYDFYILELSSFQIELLKCFKTKGLCVTNITVDHLDRYKSFQEYVDAKFKIIEHLISGGFIISTKINFIDNYLKNFKGDTIFLSTDLTEYPYLENNVMRFGDKFYCNLDCYGLYGRHNILNLALALIAVDKVIALSGDISALVKDLKCLPHRCEVAGEKNGILFIDDSKSTTIDSTRVLLEGLSSREVLILGGKYKGDNFVNLSDSINRYVDNLILYGQAADIIESQLLGHINIPIYKVKTLSDATMTAFKVAKKGQKVLLSPACSSYDAFKNYEERGESFKKYVKQL